MTNKHNLLLLLAIAFTASMAGCSAAYYHRQADDVAANLITQGQKDALGRTEPFTIEKPADTLRKRLIESQILPICCEASMGADALKPIEHWPETPKEQARNEAKDPDKVQPENFKCDVTREPLKITLNDALQIGAYNSRDYQTRKEAIFTAALDLDLQAQEFRFTYAGMLESLFSLDKSSGADVTNTAQGAEASVTKKLKTGASLASRIVFDLATLLSQDGASSKGIYFDASITVPLLSGSGEYIVAEPLTQATRNVLYAIYTFEQYKSTFAVQIASSYLSAIQNNDIVRNAYDNYMRQKSTAERAREMFEAGRMSGVEVDQAKQNEYSARDRWISARRTYGRSLDDLKISLGLPTDALIELDENELTRLAGQVADISGKTKVEGNDWNGDAAKKAISDLLEYRGPDGGPFELSEGKAVEIAFTNRLDLRTAEGKVFDAQRDVVVAADGLRAGLTLIGNASAGGTRGLGSAASDDAQLRFSRGYYTAALALDLPWEKTAERNTYRKSLITLDQSVRSLQELEDDIKLQVREALRKLIRNRESYAIQIQAVKLAESRVESTSMLMELGRVEIRDLLDAQSSLIDAQNALTLALVNYRIAELELQRDMGVLIVDEKGSWREFEPGKNE